MRTNQTSRKQASAFTILEVMLAVTILGLVMTAVYATWSAGLNGWKKTSGVSDSFQRDRVVMATLSDLTKSIVYANSKDAIYDVTYTHNEQSGNSISFVTASNLLLPASEAAAAGMRRVTIGMGRDSRGRPYLGISNQPALTATDAPEGILHVLSADVCGFVVRFREPRNGTWQDDWQEPHLLPSAIEYTVGFGANDGRTPPVVVTRAVELPIAVYALQLQGLSVLPADSTNSQVSTRDIPLFNHGGTSAGDQ